MGGGCVSALSPLVPSRDCPTHHLLIWTRDRAGRDMHKSHPGPAGPSLSSLRKRTEECTNPITTHRQRHRYGLTSRPKLPINHGYGFNIQPPSSCLKSSLTRSFIPNQGRQEHTFLDFKVRSSPRGPS
ncbi:hypothetical protein SAY87_028155 [Trapa incisa]|uniref:Uncharacterized protein n=1 Tax=Trapa incisa TaxID=236973 RepID=A0AAN7L1J4_9MYRT|nr:hypothetical protein SAY87_028155 [Trapa incisa]